MVTSEHKYRYRPNPQMSANQIAEYLQSTPQGRTRIIRNAKFPATSVTAQYGKARDCLVQFLNDGTRSLRHIVDASDFLERRQRRPGASDWIKRDSRGSIEAIETFQRGYNRFTFAKLDCRAVNGRQPVLDMWPTRVSIDLDFTVHVPSPDGPDRIGGVILLFSKGEKAIKARMEKSKTIAGLILTFCSRHLAHAGTPDRDLCLAVDVFGQREHKPAGTFSRGLDAVASAAEEIASRWESIDPPPDYDGPAPR